MIAAFATLLFLATLLVLAGVAVRMFEDSGFKIAAALRGHSPLAYRVKTAPAPVRVSLRSRSQQPVRAQARLSAAA